MANKPTLTKSDEIRAVLATTPAASAKEVVATLKKKGLDVSENLVYALKLELTKAAPKAKTPAKIVAPVKAAAPAQITAPTSKQPLGVVAYIAAAKAAAEKVGGLSNLKEIVDALQ